RPSTWPRRPGWRSSGGGSIASSSTPRTSTRRRWPRHSSISMHTSTRCRPRRYRGRRRTGPRPPPSRARRGPAAATRRARRSGRSATSWYAATPRYARRSGRAHGAELVVHQVVVLAVGTGDGDVEDRGVGPADVDQRQADQLAGGDQPLLAEVQPE